eukprot:2367207-Pleurochrysis_carterae.AAC.1
MPSSALSSNSNTNSNTSSSSEVPEDEIYPDYFKIDEIVSEWRRGQCTGRVWRSKKMGMKPIRVHDITALAVGDIVIYRNFQTEVAVKSRSHYRSINTMLNRHKHKIKQDDANIIENAVYERALSIALNKPSRKRLCLIVSSEAKTAIPNTTSNAGPSRSILRNKSLMHSVERNDINNNDERTTVTLCVGCGNGGIGACPQDVIYVSSKQTIVFPCTDVVHYMLDSLKTAMILERVTMLSNGHKLLLKGGATVKLRQGDMTPQGYVRALRRVNTSRPLRIAVAEELERTRIALPRIKRNQAMMNNEYITSTGKSWYVRGVDFFTRSNDNAENIRRTLVLERENINSLAAMKKKRLTQ